MSKLSLNEKIILIDNKFLKKFEKVVRYNPDPLSMEEPINGGDIAPSLATVVRDKHFIRIMKSLNLYNAMMVKYENHIWTFHFRFTNDYRVEVNVAKHLGSEVLVFETAVRKALEDAILIYSHNEQKKLTAHLERVEDIEYEE